MRRPLIRAARFLVIFAVVSWVVGYFAFRSPDHEYAPVTAAEAAEAEAYLAASLAPMPDGVVFSKTDGLESAVLDAPDARGVVVLAPGFSTPLEMYSAYFAALQDAGYSVAALSTRGQGRSVRALDNPEKAYVEDYARLAGDLAAFTKAQAARTGSPVFVMAVSQGGHIALRMAEDFAPDVGAYALIVPMVKIDTGVFPYPVAWAESNFYGRTGLGERYSPGQAGWSMDGLMFGEPSDCDANPATAQTQGALFALNEDLRVGGVTHRWTMATMASTRRLTDPANLAKVAAPVVMFTAGDDRLVQTPAAEAACAALSNCEVVRYPDSRHCITREDPTVRTEIIDRAVALFDAQL